MAETLDAPFTPDPELLERLTPKAEELYERHILNSTNDLWYPHKEVPWSYAQDFKVDYEWHAEDLPISPELISALFVNLLTEDNLPYYYDDLKTMFGTEGVWGKWNKRWTSEEGRHSIVIRDCLTVTRLVDPVLLEDDRMAQVSLGEVPQLQSPLDGIMYVAIQELATRVSHRRTAKRLFAESELIGDRATKKAIQQVGAATMLVANDENLHYLFYKDLAKEAFRLYPDKAMESLNRVLRTFAMPGTGIHDFEKRSEDIAVLGIYDGQIHFEKIVGPALKAIGVKTVVALGKMGLDDWRKVDSRVRALEKISSKEPFRWADRRASLRVPADLT